MMQCLNQCCAAPADARNEHPIFADHDTSPNTHHSHADRMRMMEQSVEDGAPVQESSVVDKGPAFVDLTFKDTYGNIVDKKFTEKPFGMKLGTIKDGEHMSTGAKVTRIQGKPALEAHIGAGWELTAIDGVNVTQLHLPEIASKLGEAGQKLKSCAA